MHVGGKEYAGELCADSASLTFYRELQRERAWSRIHLVPLLLAESDRDIYRREQAALAREKEIMKDVPGWEVSSCLVSRRWEGSARRGRRYLILLALLARAGALKSGRYTRARSNSSLLHQVGQKAYHSKRYQPASIVVI